jgi:hypothetical protein
MGEPCVLGNVASCRGDLLCVRPTLEDSPTCGTGIGLGDDCAEERPCELRGRCVGGTCVPVAIPGGSCNSDAQCPQGTFCSPSGCEPKPVLGQACDEAAAASPRMECIEGICVEGECTLGADAAMCRFDPSVPFKACEGYCAEGGQCVTMTKVAGVICAGDYECVEGLACLADPAAPATTICQVPECG